MRRQRRTLAVVMSKLEDVVSTMSSPALYFSAYYDNKSNIDIVSEKISEVVSHHGKVLGGWMIKPIDNDYKLGVVVYENDAAAERDRKKGINYERCGF